MKNLIRSRGLVWAMVKRDLRGRYAGSALGLCWAVFQPLVFIGVYAIAFSTVLQGKLETMGRVEGVFQGTADKILSEQMMFLLFLCVGILAWNVFQESTNRSANSFVENANLIKKVAFPEVILPIVIVCSNLLRFALELAILTVLVVLLGYFPGWVILFLPLILLFQAIFTLGLALILATLNVFFRDVSHVTSVGLFVFFWLTPIVYPETILPSWYREYVLPFHPIHKLIAMYRNVYLNHQMPNLRVMAVFLLMAVGTLVLGIGTYRGLRKEIPDLV
jgi:lipopolysaccharide transport system permease protein